MQHRNDPDGISEYTAKAELILGNILVPVDREQDLVQAVYPLAVSRLAREINFDPDAYRLSRLDTEGGSPSRTRGPVPSPEELIRKIKLPAMPTIIAKLNEVARDDKASAADIASVIQLEPSLSTSLLRLVNSPFYGFAEPVTTITRAVTALGAHQVYSLAMGDIVMKVVNRVVPGGIDLNAFWEHSIGCAIIARELSRMALVSDPETAFICGLLHDIGRLIQYVGLPQQTHDILHEVRTRRIPRLRAEAKILGYTHADIGATLLGAWKLPEPIVAAVQQHHTPVGGGNQRLAAVVHVADLLAQVLIIQPTALVYVAPLQDAAWQALNLTTDQVQACLEDLDERVEETLAVLMPH